jgi:cytochrome c oxidase cbb3-type subunit 3
MAEKKRIDEPTGTETVGHEWDGIEELDTPMPRWWLFTFYACIIWAIGYTVIYPAWPMISDATKGVSGWTSRGALDAEMKAQADRTAPIRNAIGATPIEQLSNDPKLLQAAVEGGKAAFKVYCVQCHGSGAAGSKGYPNLNDDDWLWGGDIATIHTTLVNGVRQPNNDLTRMSIMPAFGRDAILQPGEISDVADYVRTVSHQQPVTGARQRGAAVFAANCAVCHGPDGKGMRAMGAPNLTDAIWLYGGDKATIVQTVTNSRYGVMPAWGPRLDAVTVKMLAAYVHSLGGGEALPTATAPIDANPAAAENVQEANVASK